MSVTIECPECEEKIEVTSADPGDIHHCPGCEADLLVEDDGSLTVGELDGEDFCADDDPEEEDDDEEDEDDEDDFEEEDGEED